MAVVRYLPVDKIRRRSDARPLEEATVASLADSIKEIGLRCPINVRLVDGQYELIAGSHRLAACERLGETEILVTEVVEDDLHAELAMIDENLCRAELSPVDRATQTARRKAIYEELHPETKLGENQHTRVRQVGEPSASQRFTADTAARTGQSERSVQRDAERGEKIIPEAMQLVKGTELESGAYLDRLKGLSPNDQVAAAKRDLYGGPTDSGPVRDRDAIAARVKSVAATSPRPAKQHQHLVALLDEISAMRAADIISACPARERAALCTRLSHLINAFQQIMEGVAP
ncbi:MAG: ParB N-terminal domain-containing protein [Rhizobiales bacterium]|nr:ParB N-terminal domain-containing protein [Hyphomicrobiales bacterium]